MKTYSSSEWNAIFGDMSVEQKCQLGPYLCRGFLFMCTLSETACVLCRHILLCLTLSYPALYPVLETTIKRDLNPKPPGPVCVWTPTGYFHLSVFCFLLLPSTEPTHTCPCGVLFPHFLHLLTLPLLHSPNSIYYKVFHSCCDPFVWFSYSFLSNCNLSFSSTDCFP